MLVAGQRADRYTLVELLGEGGQGSVWRVEDPLAPDVPRVAKLFQTAGASAAALERLRREGRLLAGLRHPSLIRCHGIFEDLELGVIGVVLDLAGGRSLPQAGRDARWTRFHSEQLLRRVADCLAYLHESGCVHRDIKPDNILVDDGFFARPDEASFVRVIDLGIAVADEQAARLTREGTVIGTAAYMAPEVIAPFRFRGSTAAPSVDVFAFGVLAWELLVGGHPTGLAPGAGLGDYGAGYVVRAADPTWGAAGISPPWRDTLRAALALDPTARCSDGRALVASLRTDPITAPVATPEIFEPPPQITAPAGPLSPVPTGPGVQLAPAPPSVRRSATSYAWIGGAALAGLLAFGAILLGRSESSELPTPAATRPPAQPSAQPPPRPSSVRVTSGKEKPNAPRGRLTPAPDHPCHYVRDSAGRTSDGANVNTHAEWSLLAGSVTVDKVPIADATHPYPLELNGIRIGRFGSLDPSDAPRAVLDRFLAGTPTRLHLAAVGHTGASIDCVPQGSAPTVAAIKSGWIFMCDGPVRYQFGVCLAEPDPP